MSELPTRLTAFGQPAMGFSWIVLGTATTNSQNIGLYVFCFRLILSIASVSFVAYSLVRRLACGLNSYFCVLFRSLL